MSQIEVCIVKRGKVLVNVELSERLGTELALASLDLLKFLIQLNFLIYKHLLDKEDTSIRANVIRYVVLLA